MTGSFDGTGPISPGSPRWVDPGQHTRRKEILVFVVLAVLVWPIVTVGIVGGYGFAVWMYQQVAGPPGPPRR